MKIIQRPLHICFAFSVGFHLSARPPHGAPNPKDGKALNNVTIQHKTKKPGQERTTWVVKVEQPGGVKRRAAGKENGDEHVVSTAGNPVVISPMDTHIHTPIDRLTDKVKDAWLAKHGGKQ